jgi:hypothetical protein
LLTSNWLGRTKTCVPCPLAPTGHSQKSSMPVTCYNGLGAARGQRLRKGPCASYPTRFSEVPHFPIAYRWAKSQITVKCHLATEVPIRSCPSLLCGHLAAPTVSLKGHASIGVSVAAGLPPRPRSGGIFCTTLLRLYGRPRRFRTAPNPDEVVFKFQVLHIQPQDFVNVDSDCKLTQYTEIA